MKNIQIKWLSCLPYSKGLELQQDFVVQSQRTQYSYLLGLEHPSVITLGLNSQKQDILVSHDFLKCKEIEVVLTKRGGGVTCHSPGQLVIYPIIPLKKWKLSVRQYVALLENVTRDFLESLGVICLQEKKNQTTAIYTQRGKIAFFGVQVQRGIACHGLAININNDLDLFSLIRPCGLDFESLDSVSYYTKLTPSAFLLKKWATIFCQYISPS